MRSFLNTRVYYGDTDAGGVVYHGAYIDFYDRARTEFFRELGIEHKRLNEDHKVFIVRKINLEYLHPGFMDEILSVNTKVSEVRKASISITQLICNEAGKTINRCDVTLIFVDVIRKKPVAIPPDIFMKLSSICAFVKDDAKL